MDLPPIGVPEVVETHSGLPPIVAPEPVMGNDALTDSVGDRSPLSDPRPTPVAELPKETVR